LTRFGGLNTTGRPGVVEEYTRSVRALVQDQSLAVFHEDRETLREGVYVDSQRGGDGFTFAFLKTNRAWMAATVTATQTLKVHGVLLR
jgi:hypothetical protein